MPPRPSPSWEQNYARRLRFERPASAVYPGLRCQPTGRRRYARVVYSVKVPVAEYEPREIELHFRRTTAKPHLTRVYADGPADSPHRYTPHAKDPLARPSLCMWYPDDPRDQRWVAADGLLSLIEMTRVHLFKQAYWRETGEWLGEEVSHHQRPRGEEC